MTAPYRDWRHYQEETAQFFRNLGCSAEVEALVQGPHARHQVDVWVRFLRYGIDCKWVIECKLWNRSVSKEKVMALKGIVDDVGADRGIIVTEKGFQSGAYDAARGKNLTLVTSLEQFKSTALADLQSQPLTKSGTGPRPGSELYLFPEEDRPQSIVSFDGRLIVGN